MNTYYVYVLASRNHRYLSVRSTADLKFGIRHHRRAISRKLGRKNVYQKLVHLEAFDGLTNAIDREREINSWSSARLRHLVTRRNPTWKPLSISRYLARNNRHKEPVAPAGYKPRNNWAT